MSEDFDAIRCVAKTASGSRCSKAGAFVDRLVSPEGGSRYCSLHLPENVAARRKDSRERYRSRWEAYSTKATASSNEDFAVREIVREAIAFVDGEAKLATELGIPYATPLAVAVLKYLRAKVAREESERNYREARELFTKRGKR